MNKQYRFLNCLIVVLISFTLTSANITIQGFTPQKIDKATIQYEYKRIYKMLAPHSRTDTSSLIVSYYSKATRAQVAYSLPEWGGGGAIGSDTIVVSIDKKPFLEHSPYQVTVHELVHIVINRHCKDVAIPRWFHEGLAMTLSGEASERENIVVSKAIFSGSLMPLGSIDSVNRFGRFRAELAYCQSRQAMLYLIDTYGIEAMAEILDAVNRTDSFWQGFYEVLQLSEKELGIYYRKFILQHHGRYFWLVDQYLVWVGILFLFLSAYVITVIRIRKKRQLMAEEDQDLENATEEIERG